MQLYDTEVVPKRGVTGQPSAASGQPWPSHSRGDFPRKRSAVVTVALIFGAIIMFCLGAAGALAIIFAEDCDPAYHGCAIE